LKDEGIRSALTMTRKTAQYSLLLVFLVFLFVSCSDSKESFAPCSASCDVAAPKSLQVCIDAVNAASRSCYSAEDAACGEGDVDIADALSTLADEIQCACEDGELLSLSVDAVVGRLQNACKSHADSIAWRTFGGPQGAVWPDAGADGQDCLQRAHEIASQFVDDSLVSINNCLSEWNCDAAAIEGEQQAATGSAVAAISKACPSLDALIAVDPATYVERAQDQIDCIAAAAHDSVDPLSIECGPSNVDVVPVRGEWTQIVLDTDKWGTLCGDGTEYAIHIRLAPEGKPLDRVIIALQGGGVCLFEDDCRSRLESSPGLFNAQDDSPIGSGLVSEDPINPFADWTKVYLPYCDQGVFIGGGIVEQFSDFQLPRFGAINLRAGIRVARDIIWKEMDAEGGSGFRPDELIALFGGFSAGAYGTLYNYHWVLDDLQWPRTAAFPDAGGALDNGFLGVRLLGFTKIPEWGAKNFLPPYCFSGHCAVGPDNYRAISPRLKQVPEQQYLILSNQKDNTQQGDAFFDDEAKWINAVRRGYCDTKDLPGIQYYLTSDSVNSVHVVSLRDEFYYGDVAGERMVDWFWRAVTDPDSITDRAEEGNFTTDIPGSRPFPCELP
jgi:hypothetical protein